MKYCSKCGTDKPFGAFGICNARPDGLSAYCRACKCRYKRKKSRAKAQAAFKQQNPEKVKLWSERTRRNRSARLIALKAERRAAKLNAMPKWVDKTAITKMYQGAKYLTRLTGIPFVVDHVIPLLSPVVCGLHSLDNLQYLTHSENSRKQNRIY